MREYSFFYLLEETTDLNKPKFAYPKFIKAESPVCARNQYTNMLVEHLHQDKLPFDLSRVYTSVLAAKLETA